MSYVLFIVIAGVVFLTLILSLAIPPKYTKKVLGWLASLIAVAALGMYGYGYCYQVLSQEIWDGRDLATAVLRTVFDACKIFGGSDNWDDIKVAFSNPLAWEIFFRTILLLALTTSASAVVMSLGSRLLREIRMWGLRTRDIALIYGLRENTLDFGRELSKQEKTAVLYVDHGEQERFSTAVDRMGAVFRSDSEALNGSVRFLRSIGLRPGRRMLRVYALESSVNANHHFAVQLLASLEARGIHPEQTSLTILSVTEETDDSLQAIPGRYGFGSVLSINESDMAARVLIRNYPPCHAIDFDENGRARNDFHGVIIGFGQTGQAVLRQLVMNSQFQGSTSHIAVFAPDYEKRMGWLSHECGAMLEHYDIRFYPYDGRSVQLYDYLEEHSDSVNYVTVCAGSDVVNAEITQRVEVFLRRRNSSAPVLVCSSQGVSRCAIDEPMMYHRIYIPEILCSNRIDRMAMVLHHSYCGDGDMEENWKHCSYFDRMSSRAAADFYDALLYAAGKTREEALEDWNPQGALLDNLAGSEHVRWNAFHYGMGFRAMTEEEFVERAERYRTEKIRITKDLDKRIHACMVPWEALDAYSAKENSVTGGNANYAEYDRINVRDLVKVLKIAMENP